MSLNNINFGELIELDVDDIDSYSYNEYAANNHHHKHIIGYCTLCDELGINTCGEEGFRLRNMSHGAHSSDFLQAFIGTYDTSDWNQDGVMFIMEGPSKDYGIYERTEIVKDKRTYDKKPSKDWYWIHSDLDVKGYPQHFKGGTYGGFVASAIITFKLKNAYLTNLIKCGMNGPNDSFRGIDYYNPACIEMCRKTYLQREIELMNPKVIFTFGSKVYNYVSSYVDDNIRVVGLPHPAGQRRGFKDEYYNVLYFCMMAKYLFKEKVISEPFYKELMMKFAE